MAERHLKLVPLPLAEKIRREAAKERQDEQARRRAAWERRLPPSGPKPAA
jgi:hypothetical protein